MLDELGVATEIWPMPVEIPDAIPFPDDRVHARYDPDAVHRFWLALVEMERVFKVFRARFVGKSSPVHLFWGALDLASTRFSGRTAPPHPGGAPNCGPHVMWEAYSHEVSSCGYWPGPPGEEGVFYAYAYPDPPGYRDTPSRPPAPAGTTSLGEFVLPYELVRTAADPDAVLLDFLQSTYEAAATTAALGPRRARTTERSRRTMADTCTHLDTVADVTPSSDGCEDCLRIGGRWVHLRLCMALRSRRLLRQLPEPPRHRPLARAPRPPPDPLLRTRARTGGGATPTSCSSRSTAHRPRHRTPERRGCRT